MAYLAGLELPPDTGADVPVTTLATPDPPPARTQNNVTVSLEDQIDILGADIVRGPGRSVKLDLDPHLLYKTLCLLSTGGLWFADGRPVVPASVLSELKRILWRAISEAPGHFRPGEAELGSSMRSLVDHGTLVPKVMAGFGFCAARASLFVRANNHFKWFPSLLHHQVGGGTSERLEFNDATCAIIDAIHNANLAPVIRFVRGEGAAEIYARQPSRDRIGVEAIDVSKYGYAQFVLKTGRRPAKVVRARDHHKRGKVYATTSRDVVGLLNSLLVDMRTLCVKRHTPPHEHLIPGFMNLWATWKDRDTRAAIISYTKFHGRVTHVLWPTWDPDPVDFVDTPDFAALGLAVVGSDIRPPPNNLLPDADALFPAFDHVSTQDFYDEAADYIRHPTRPGYTIGGGRFTTFDDRWKEGEVDSIADDARADHEVRILQLRRKETLRSATTAQLTQARRIPTLTEKIVSFFDDNYLDNAYEALLHAEAVFGRASSYCHYAAPPPTSSRFRKAQRWGAVRPSPSKATSSWSRQATSLADTSPPWARAADRSSHLRNAGGWGSSVPTRWALTTPVCQTGTPESSRPSGTTGSSPTWRLFCCRRPLSRCWT